MVGSIIATEYRRAAQRKTAFVTGDTARVAHRCRPHSTIRSSVKQCQNRARCQSYDDSLAPAFAGGYGVPCCKRPGTGLSSLRILAFLAQISEMGYSAQVTY